MAHFKVLSRGLSLPQLFRPFLGPPRIPSYINNLVHGSVFRCEYPPWKELVNLFVRKYVGGVIFDLIRCKIELTDPPHRSVPRRSAS